MDQFLQFCRTNLPTLINFKKIYIVVGNESCDLDSVTSAIVLAYIKYHELTSSVGRQQDDSEMIVLPLLNVFREDLHLRREIVFWFEKVLQFDMKWFICRDEIDFDAIKSSQAQVFISLVDHNENKEFVRLLPRAEFDEIIDHHQPQLSDSSHFKCDPSKVQIDTSIGSCCSLIALRYFKTNITRHKFGSGSQEIYDSQIALILYGPILLDTICFSHSAKRFNAKDYEAINKLEDLMKHPADVEPSLYDRNEVYQRLVSAKNSLEGLTFEDLLRKDMKIVESISDNNLAICISSITGILLTEMSLRDKLKELKNFCNNPPNTAVFSESRPRLFNAIVLMNLDNRIPNNLRRQLGIYCTNKHLMRTIATCIERSELELELITALESLRIYNQNNLTVSRKIVLPIISTILNGPGRTTDVMIKINKPFISCSSSHTKPKSSMYTICTAEVDPEFLLNYHSETVQVPEFEELIRKSHLSSTKELTNLSIKKDRCPENTKRAEMINGNGDLILSSAPSSFIQQPDSYYGSFIDDSFVGEFVGDYPDPDSMEHENILVMDADGQNLVILNPAENSCLSHTHEIEFDFESFGPESIIYAGNIESGQEKKDNSDKKIELKKEDQRNDDDDNSYHPNDVDCLSDELKNQNQNETLKTSKNKNYDLNYTELNSEASKINNDIPTINIEDESKKSKQNSDLILNKNESFNRNSTLTKSQRKKVVPQVTIKNLVLTNDAFSPALEQVMFPPLKSISPLTSEKKNDENDESSSQTNKNNHSVVMNDPLGVTNSNSLNHNPNSSNLGLNRNKSMKKKIEVNYTMFLNNSVIDNKNMTINDSNNATVDVTSALDSQDDTNKLPYETNVNDKSCNRRPSLPLSIMEIRSINLQVIEPYKKVISHGGHLKPSSNSNALEFSSPAIILFSTHYLPDRSRPDYNNVMDNLFLYVVSTLHNMVADDYILIYLHNGGGNMPSSSCQSINNMPTFSWLKRCYQMIDRKLKKNLKGLYLVHPTFWLKTLIIMSKPFISSKFSRKLKFVRSLEELKRMIPIDDLAMPESIEV